MAKTNPKSVARQKRVKRIRKKISGTSETPRLRVFRSARNIYGQVIDDTKGHTLVSISSLQADAKDPDSKGKCSVAHQVGMLLAVKAKAAGISNVVFDRGGNIYHGRIKAFSEGARKGGLKF